MSKKATLEVATANLQKWWGFAQSWGPCMPIGGTAHLCQKHMQKWFNLWLIIFLFQVLWLCNSPCQIWTFPCLATRNYGEDWNAMKTCFKSAYWWWCQLWPRAGVALAGANFSYKLLTDCNCVHWMKEIKGRKFHTGKIASGRNYPTDRVLRYYLRVGGIFVRLKSPESHHGDTLFISSIAPENNKLSGKMQFKGKMMQFRHSFITQRKGMSIFMNENEILFQIFKNNWNVIK